MKFFAYFCLLLLLLPLTHPQCLPSCSTCSSNSQCTQCITNNYITIASHPQLGCLPCPPSCKTCTNEYSSCSQCSTGYYHSTDLSSCERCGVNCEECNEYNPETCLTCEEGYYLISTTGLCQHCSNYENALTCRQNIILTCEEGFYVSGGQKCLACSSNCKTCTTSTFCIACLDGYYGSTCQQCDSSCSTCINANSCMSCSSGYYLKNYQCNTCDDYPLCYECTATGQCISCVDGYYLASSNTCQTVGSYFAIPHCLKYEYSLVNLDFSCIECDTGYYVSTFYRCLPCSLLCDNCDGFYSSSSCSACSWMGKSVESTICIMNKNYNQMQLKYINQWNHPNNFIYTGTTLLLSEAQCSSSKLSTAVKIEFGTIQGYSLSFNYKLIFSLTGTENIIITFKMNDQVLTNITIINDEPIKCSVSDTDVYTYLGVQALNAALLTSSTNYLSLVIYNGFVAVSEGVFTYQPCHQSCQLCSSYYTCTLCYDSSLYLEGHACVEKCSDLYYYEDGMCTLSCSDGRYPDTTSSEWECATCKTECSSCSSADLCTICAAGYYLSEGQCLSSCPDQYFANSVTNRCQTCYSPCYTCTSEEICLSCSLNFLSNGKCVGSCQDGFFPSISTMKCEACISPCVSCTTESTCTSCSGSLVLHENRCINSCPAKYTEVNGVCQRCEAPCYTCQSSIVSCTKCSSGFLWEGTCVVNCPGSTYQQFQTMCCKQCDEPCLECSSSSTKCTSCIDGYILHSSTQQCITTEVCTQTIGFFQNSDQCTACPSECTDCTSFDICVSCTKGYYLTDQQCLPSCPLDSFPSFTSRTCELCSGNCLTCAYEFDFCTSCPQNYVLNYLGYCISSCNEGKLPSTCESCDYPCSQCINVTSQCTQCVESYYLSQSKCLQSCYIGFYPNENNKCVACISPCERCLSADKCTHCGSIDGKAYFLKVNDVENGIGQCVESCPQFFYQQEASYMCKPCQQPCKECSSQTECKTCLNGYLQIDTCVQSCSFGYYSLAQICELCVSPCLSCTSEENCVTCVGGYYLYENKCTENCPSGTVQIVSTSTCQPCQYPCEQCSGSTENCTKCSQPENCSSCIVYFYWQNQCLNSCPSISYKQNDTCVPCISPCYTCTQAAICTSCISNYYLLNGLCSETCTDTYYPDVSTMECQKCQYPCLRCSGVNTCIDCLDGIYHQGTCILSFSCPSGYYINVMECEECDSSCQTCSESQTNCLSCSDPLHYLLDGNCLQVCSVKYYPSSSNGQLICQACYDECSSCTALEICTQCISGYYLMNGVCVDICPPSHFYQNSTCQLCTSPCATCFYSSDNCLSCEENYLLYQFNCISECPQKTYTDTVVGRCLECEYPCELCTSSQNCTKCLAGFYLNNLSLCLDGCPLTMTIDSEGIRCIDDCPQNQYKISYTSYYKCSQTCSYPHILKENACLSHCEGNYYINENLQCVPSSNINSSDLTTAHMRILQRQDETLSLLLIFSQNVQYQLMSSLATVLSVKVFMAPQYVRNLQTDQAVTFSIIKANQQYIHVSLELKESVNGQLVMLQILENSNLLIRSKISSIPLQGSSFQAQLPRYQVYPQIYSSSHFKIFGEVIVDFVLIIGLFLFLWNWYAKIYEFLHLSQMLYLLAALQVAYPPNLNYFLQGFKWSHFYQVGNWFMDQSYSQITDAPVRISSLFIDVNFMRIWGHIFCLIIILAAVLFLVYIGSFLVHASNQTLKKIGEVLSRKLSVIKWSHIHDFVMSVTMISVFGFMVQTYDYYPDSTLQILGITFSYFVVIVIGAYYVFMGYKLHKLVQMSITDPQRFCHKNYLFRDDMMSITESAIHPKQLYLNYLRAIRILVVGAMVGLFSQSPSLCVGSFIVVLVISALVYLIAKPYPEQLQNLLLGWSDLAIVCSLVFTAAIMQITQDNPSIQNLQMKWGLGWGSIILSILGVFMLLVELVVSIIRGNSCPQELAGEDHPKDMQNVSVPRRIYVYDKKEFEGWQCEEGSALNMNKVADDKVKEK